MHTEVFYLVPMRSAAYKALQERELPELSVPRLPYLYTGWQTFSSSSPSLSGTE